jgi:biopolymer transport protein ExbD
MADINITPLWMLFSCLIILWSLAPVLQSGIGTQCPSYAHSEGDQEERMVISISKQQRVFQE